MRNQHPAEAAKGERKSLEYSFLQSNELILVNMPDSTTEESIRKLTGLKGVHINSVRIIKSIDKKQISYAVVQFGDVRSVEKVKRSIYNVWLEDKKIRVIT